MYQGIYLIKEREFKKTNEEVYKIGRSHKISERIKGYPKDSSLHLIVLCKECEIVEKKLINLLTNKFKLLNNYGINHHILSQIQ